MNRYKYSSSWRKPSIRETYPKLGSQWVLRGYKNTEEPIYTTDGGGDCLKAINTIHNSSIQSSIESFLHIYEPI